MIRGAEPEADRPRVEAGGVHAADRHQRLQPRLAGAAEAPQAGAHEPAVLPLQRHDVADGGERHEVEVLVGGRGVEPGALEQRLGELVRHAGRAQVRARIAADARVDDRGVGQGAVRPRRVVVGDHHVEPRRARRRHLVDRGDRAVGRDQQAGAAGRQPLDGGRREPVAVLEAARQIPVDLRAQGAQDPHEDGRRAHAVGVVVAVDRDPRPAPGVAEDALGRLAQAAEGVERVRGVGREEGPRGPGVAEAAADEHLGEHRRDAEVRGQALGGAAVVGRDGERDVRLEHRRSV